MALPNRLLVASMGHRPGGRVVGTLAQELLGPAENPRWRCCLRVRLLAAAGAYCLSARVRRELPGLLVRELAHCWRVAHFSTVDKQLVMPDLPYINPSGAP